MFQNGHRQPTRKDRQLQINPSHECLHENTNGQFVDNNGIWNGVNVGSVFDDFVVPAGSEWALNGIRWSHYWYGPGFVATSIDIRFRSDKSGSPGNLLNQDPVPIATYNETVTDRRIHGFFFISESVAYFQEPVVLSPGTYWFEAKIVAPSGTATLELRLRPLPLKGNHNTTHVKQQQPRKE